MDSVYMLLLFTCILRLLRPFEKELPAVSGIAALTRSYRFFGDGPVYRRGINGYKKTTIHSSLGKFRICHIQWFFFVSGTPFPGSVDGLSR